MLLRCEVQDALVQCHHVGNGPEHWVTVICTKTMAHILRRELKTGDRFVVRCSMEETSPPGHDAG